MSKEDWGTLYGLLSQKPIDIDKMLDLLSAYSERKLEERDAYLLRKEYNNARYLHHSIARLYKEVAEAVPEDQRRPFLEASYYWRATGNRFWDPAPPIKPKRTKHVPSGMSRKEIFISDAEENEVTYIVYAPEEITDIPKPESFKTLTQLPKTFLEKDIAFADVGVELDVDITEASGVSSQSRERPPKGISTKEDVALPSDKREALAC